jgi:hypothetical protein
VLHGQNGLGMMAVAEQRPGAGDERRLADAQGRVRTVQAGRELAAVTVRLDDDYLLRGVGGARGENVSLVKLMSSPGPGVGTARVRLAWGHDASGPPNASASGLEALVSPDRDSDAACAQLDDLDRALLDQPAAGVL